MVKCCVGGDVESICGEVLCVKVVMCDNVERCCGDKGLWRRVAVNFHEGIFFFLS